ncbi:MAG TPA: OB-fold nucleic acid binding domain-containing protein [Candidatus Sumerlaeota bacterium]|nr:OB-fold nucleic acid binding domain-containing protein [Candidatus Sumerlaeota bacterium]
MRKVAVGILLITAGIFAAPAFGQQPAAPPSSAAAAASAFKPFENAVPAASLQAGQVGSEVAIVGTVVEYVPSTKDNIPHRLTLVKKETGGVEIVFWNDTAPKILANGGAVKVGAKVSVKGKLEDFKGRSLQVRVKSPSQIRLEGAPATLGAAASAPQVPAKMTPHPVQSGASGAPIPPAGPDGFYKVADIPTIKDALMGKTISITGTVSGYKTPANDRAPHVFAMKDGEGEIEFIFWTQEDQKVPVPTTPGTVLYATGELQKYQDRLQINIDDLKNVSTSILPKERIAVPKAKAPQNVGNAQNGWTGKSDEVIPDRRGTVKLAPKAEVNLRELGPQHEGAVVTLKGKADNISAGENGATNLILRGQGGFAHVRLPAAVKDKPAVGDVVQLVGKVTYDAVRSSVVVEAVEPFEITIEKPVK